jgi:phytoene/squalene synthetase
LSFDADTQACAALTERGDPDRFAATMALPVGVRARLFPLWAFNIEVARAPWVSTEPLIAQMRLQWWHDALEEIAADGFVRRHEVVTPLALWLTPEQARRLQALVAARHSDTETTPFAE